MQKQYRYGMVNRPLSIGTCPKGFVAVEPRPAKGEPHHEVARHGVIVYATALSDRESASYELAPLLDGAAADEMALRVALDIVGRDEAADTLAFIAEYPGEYDGHLLHAARKFSGGYPPSIGDPAGFVAKVLETLRASTV